jgi:hypothetical protein
MALTGARLREEAVRVMAEQVGVRRPIHYRDWYDLVVAEGFVVIGKRPLSTFLTGVSRSSIIGKGNEPGTYVLEPQLLDPLRAELSEVEGESADVALLLKTQPTVRQSVRQHAVNLKATIRRLERQLSEGERALEHARRAASRIHAA